MKIYVTVYKPSFSLFVIIFITRAYQQDFYCFKVFGWWFKRIFEIIEKIIVREIMQV